jgi:hypothetical protein
MSKIKFKKQLLVTLGATILLVWFSGTNTFAQSKKHLAQMVMDHDMKIASLEEIISNLDSGSENETLAPESKQALLKEVDNFIRSGIYTTQYDGEKTVTLNVTNYEIKETNGKVVLQIFTEGNYDWTDTLDGYGNTGIGRSFARNFIFNFDVISKMYGLEMHYEFYENGERIKVFTTLE